MGWGRARGCAGWGMMVGGTRDCARWERRYGVGDGRSFGAQAVDGVGEGGFDGAPADGQHGDDEGGGDREGEDLPVEVDAIFEALQPAVHSPGAEGGGDEDGEGEEAADLFAEKP